MCEPLEPRLALSTLGEIGAVTFDLATTAGNAGSRSPSLSMDLGARWVAFESDASDLVPGDTNDCTDVFVRDLLTGTTRRVSLAADGSQLDGPSSMPRISADGTKVAFLSRASNVGERMPYPSLKHLYLVTIAKPEGIRLVDSSTAGVPGNADVLSFDMSADGSSIAFDTRASNLAPGDRAGSIDVFVKDTAKGGLAWASQDLRLEGTASVSSNPSISADGRFVAFEGEPGSIDGQSEIYVRDMLWFTEWPFPKLLCVSTGPGGVKANGGSHRPRISEDGRYVAFDSEATDLTTATGRDGLVYRASVLDYAVGGFPYLSPGRTPEVVASRLAGMYPGSPLRVLDLSPDGATAIVTVDDAPSALRVTAWTNILEDLPVKIDESPLILPPVAAAIGLSGTRLALATPRALTPGDVNGADDIYWIDIAPTISTPVATLASARDESLAGRVAAATTPDGKYTVFTAMSPDPLSGVLRQQVIRRDNLNGSTLVVSTTRDRSPNDPGVPGDDDSGSPVISDDGRFVAFVSRARNLISGLRPFGGQVYIKDLEPGMEGLIRVVSANAAGFPDRSGSACQPAISGDGRYVAFVSGGLNLVPGGDEDFSRAAPQVYLKNMTTGAVERVSEDAGGNPGDGPSDRPSVALGGRVVAFRSTSTNLVANDTNGAPDLFVKDLDTGAVFRVTSTASAHRVGPPSLSADGRSVAFITNDPDSIRDFVQPRGAGAFVRVIGSDEPIPVGRMAAEEVNEQVRISADGSHVVYKSRLANSDEITPEVDGIINAFLVRVGPRKVWRISRTIADAVVGGLSLSGDGQVTTFATAASPNGPPRLYRLDLARWRTITLSGSGVDENMPPNSVVGTLAGSNDMNAYQFALVDDASDDDFKLVGRVVQTRLALDHEATPTRTIRVRVTDAWGESIEQDVTFDVRDVNEAPSIDPSFTPEVNEGETKSFPLKVIDPEKDRQRFSFSLINAPSWVTIDSRTGVITASPPVGTPSIVGDQMKLRIEDDGTPSRSFVTGLPITVHPINTNRAPRIESPGILRVDEGHTITVPSTWSDEDAVQNHAFSLIGAPAWVTIHSKTGEITAAPPEGVGALTTATIQVRILDDGAPPLSATAGFTVIVNAIPHAPRIESPGTIVVEEGRAKWVAMRAWDPDAGQTLRYELDARSVAGTFVDPAVGTFIVPHGLAPGVYLGGVWVTDSGTPPLRGAVAFPIVVRNVAPRLEVPDTVRGGQGQALGLDIRFGDPGNGPWTVVVNPGDGSPLEVVPTWSRSMAVAHRYDRAGAFPLTVAVWDAFGGVDMRVITALVVPTTQPTPSPVPIRLDRVEPVRDARGAVTHLVLAFTGALDAARASQVSAYSLRGPGRDGRLGTRDDTTVRIRAATYAPEARAVVLQLGSAVPGVSGLRFSIRSGLVLDPAGRMLDGDADGAPGGDAVRTL